ncbi:efflux RND transporter periplasmic adaptor subunit [Aneurinibacillus tyrosinisolvens]|uniref:efflux RND transporter periplasmic adaptor subunit n=1 Tax=Aneurinibacillus tyrosinisolvens TaxID=1443435 RepID=UPI00063F0E62|nr:efflux RND transporter periplasmic adaptor subunit [Aneurinibacillus tyrosinisolvens]
MAKSKISKGLGVVLLGTVLLAGCGTNAQEVMQQGPVSVKTAQVQAGVMSSGPVYTGTVQPNEKVNIVPKVGGKIASIPVEVGTRVQKGQVLFALDDKDLRNAVARADAAVAASSATIQTAEQAQKAGVVQATGGAVSAKNGMVQAKSGMVQAKGGILQAQGAVTQARSGVEQAQHGVEGAKLDFQKANQAFTDAKTNRDRMKQLFDQGAASQVQVDQAETAYVNAQAAYQGAQIAQKNAQEKLAAAQKGLTVATNSYNNATSGYQNATSGYQNAESGYQTAQQQIGIASGTAGIEASRQGLKQAAVGAQIARDALSDAVVRSPIDGIIGVKNAEVGEMVSPQSPAPVLVVANLDTVNVLVYLPAERINQVKPGNKVQVKAVAFNYVTTGTVKTVSPLDEKGKGYPVQISVPNETLQLKSGMVTEITLADPKAPQGLVIPASALVKAEGKSFVFVAEGDHAVKREVVVGQQNGSQVLVKSGIKAGEKVVTTQAEMLSDQDKISVQP